MSHSNAYRNGRTTSITWYSGDLEVEVRWEGPTGQDSSLFIFDGPRFSGLGVNEIRIFMVPDQLRKLRDAINAALPEEAAAADVVAWGALDPGVGHVS